MIGGLRGTVLECITKHVYLPHGSSRLELIKLFESNSDIDWLGFKTQAYDWSV